MLSNPTSERIRDFAAEQFEIGGRLLLYPMLKRMVENPVRISSMAAPSIDRISANIEHLPLAPESALQFDMPYSRPFKIYGADELYFVGYNCPKGLLIETPDGSMRNRSQIAKLHFDSRPALHEVPNGLMGTPNEFSAEEHEQFKILGPLLVNAYRNSVLEWKLRIIKSLTPILQPDTLGDTGVICRVANKPFFNSFFYAANSIRPTSITYDRRRTTGQSIRSKGDEIFYLDVTDVNLRLSEDRIIEFTNNTERHLDPVAYQELREVANEYTNSDGENIRTIADRTIKLLDDNQI